MEIHHFKRANLWSSYKELIREEVEVGSATYNFIKRMEEQRVNRECTRSLDMRGLVDAPCNSLVFHGRTLWLDDISYGLFIKGLKENNGVFTIGTYEAIMNGEHTYRGQREKERLARRSKAAEEKPEPIRSSDKSEQTARDTQSSNNQCELQIVPLGYFHRRREDRVRYSTEIQVQIQGGTYAAKTRDISEGGMKIQLVTQNQPAPGDEVQVSFPRLQERYVDQLPLLTYIVVRTEYTQNRLQLSLKLTGQKNNPVSEYVRNAVQRKLTTSRGRHLRDAEDAFLTTNSLLFERYYTQSTSAIPLFLVEDSQKRIRLRAICINENNKNDLKAFETLPGEYDFTSLGYPSRIQKLYELAQKGGREDSLIAVYRPTPDSSPQVVTDFDYDYGRNWYNFIALKRKQKYFHVFKVLLRPVFRPDSRRITQDLKKLSEKSPDLSQQLLQEADTLVAAGCLFNLDAQVAKWTLPDAASVTAPPRIALDDNDLQDNSSSPMLLDVGYMEKHRSENRYHHPLSVLLYYKDQSYETTTRDFSIHGLSLYIDSQDFSLKEGESIQVSFPSLKLSSGVFGIRKLKLEDIPYEVMGWERGKRRVLRLRLMDSRKKEDVVNALTKIIELNPERLKIDLSDSVKAASSSLYSALAAESTATLPLHIYRDKTTRELKMQIGMSEHAGNIVDFFEVADGEFDFQALSNEQRIVHLTQRLRETNSSCEHTLFLYKEPIENQARFEIHSAAEFEFSDFAEKLEFINRAMEHDYRFVKIRVSTPTSPPAAEIDTILETLREYSPVRTQELASEYDQLIAVGDLLDITQEALEKRTYS